MKAPLNWIKEFVAVEASAGELAERLTSAGLEVEEVEIFGRDRCSGVKVCEVARVERVAEADGLIVCEVNDGAGIRSVVCGARNVAPGDKAPYAPPGAVLAGGRRIEKTEVRGIESEGMLCAEDELGLSDDHTGVMRLPDDAVVGADFAALLGEPEPVFAIEVTPNRPDCLSIIGIAREVAALYGLKLNVAWPEPAGNGAGAKLGVKAVVADAEACPRYTLRVIRELAVSPSPIEIQKRLLMCGCRPINNVVDITNYVMFECGQPLHAFDLDLVRGDTIYVRRAAADEDIVTLDGERRQLNPEHLVIADGKGPVAAAGIMGGESSGITNGTRAVLLESACFNPSVTRRGVRSLGFSSESSYRFERGVDIALCERASRRAAALMLEHAGGIIEPGVIDEGAKVFEERKIKCRFDRVRALLGCDVKDDEIAGAFESLGLAVPERGGGECAVLAPTFRPDLASEADLIEEVARIRGLDNIPADAPTRLPGPGPDDSQIRAAMEVRSRLAGMGLYEIMNYSFVSARLLDLFSEPAASRLALPNPISSDHVFMRPSLVPQMVETLGRNTARQAEEAAFFEMGRVFAMDGGRYCEEERLAIGLMGPVGFGALDKRRKFGPEQSLLWAKGILERLCRAMRAAVELRREPAGAFRFPIGCLRREHMAAIYIDGVECGVLGAIARPLAEEWRINTPAAVFEISARALTGRVPGVPAAAAPPAFPMTTRDIAMIVPDDMEHGRITGAIRKNSTKELTEIKLFDIYKSKEFGVSKKSMAYSLTYQSPERTLTDEEVNAMHAAVVAALKSELGVEVREG